MGAKIFPDIVFVHVGGFPQLGAGRCMSQPGRAFVDGSNCFFFCHRLLLKSVFTFGFLPWPRAIGPILVCFWFSPLPTANSQRLRADPGLLLVFAVANSQ